VLISPKETLKVASWETENGTHRTPAVSGVRTTLHYLVISLPTSLETEYIGASQYGY
jgi:hypothetical protein